MTDHERPASAGTAGETRMEKKIVKRWDWTKEDIRTLKALAREKARTTVIGRCRDRRAPTACTFATA